MPADEQEKKFQKYSDMRYPVQKQDFCHKMDYILKDAYDGDLSRFI